ncbi:hypothetical protein ACFQ4L_10575 [Lapidilactobacillus mulanensis]|uniref:Uncharacterized protein n=1 Tax=Lapidilactobacillus mulanensis TaxID=2485999 RepID=A0ABW4DSQ4_9LACO|nr:hypothetical protein [Lapidilactobacillus mulanensis]
MDSDNILRIDRQYGNEFMTYEQLINRLRKDLDNPGFFAFDLMIPHNEGEYQTSLKDMKVINKLLRRGTDNVINIDSFRKHRA